MENVHFRILAAGYPHDAQVCFWIWSARRPVSRHSGLAITEANGCGVFFPRSQVVAERSNMALLTTSPAQRVCLVVALAKAGGSLRCEISQWIKSSMDKTVGR